MTEDEAKSVLKKHGWTPRFRQVHSKQGTYFLYAYRRRQGKLEERYITTVNKLEELTEADILLKLTK